MDWCCLSSLLNNGFVQVLTALALLVFLFKTFAKRRDDEKRKARRVKWNNVGKDVVVLHMISRAKSCPNLSPFVIKLETFLRMAHIDYIVDFEEPQSYKGKTPWITINGQEVTDSQLCIEYLTKLLDKSQSKHLTPEEKSIAHAFQVMWDEHFYFGLLMDRYVYQQGKMAFKNMDVPIPKILMPLAKPILKVLVKHLVSRQCYHQGMGRHEQKDVESLSMADVEATSLHLGNKPFLMGDMPTEVDCTLFANMVMLMYCAQDALVYKVACETKYKNLIQHMKRMKKRYWKDWDDCKAK